MNRLFVVRIDALHRRNARTPILDISGGITRQEIILIMTPCHAPKGGIVGGEDEFEGECETVPEGEFSFLIAGEETSTSGGETERHDGRGVFGPRDVSHVC